MTEEELTRMIRDYQQRLAAAELQAVTLTAQLATRDAKLAELAAAAAPKPGPAKAGANA